MVGEHGRRFIVVGDIHGHFKMVKSLVEEEIRFDPSCDVLVFVGDYIDRGPDSAGVAGYLADLQNQSPQAIKLLWGNHEDMARLATIEDSGFFAMEAWMENGAAKTIDSFGSIAECKKELVGFFPRLALYCKFEGFVIAHASFPDFQVDDDPVRYRDHLLWSRNYASYAGEDVLICGHTPHNEITAYKHAIVVDTGVHCYGKLSALDLISFEKFEVTR